MIRDESIQNNGRVLHTPRIVASKQPRALLLALEKL
jgi:hypothetical protein